ncbi:hypothetical protein ACP4OV_008506 [Aristida adscensionis]
MCEESECCGCFGRHQRFACGFCIGLAIIAAVAVIAVLLLGYGHASRVRFAVDDASLTRFTVTASPATAVSYNLTLTLAARNPNWAMAATFRSLDAEYLFDRERFDRVAAVASPEYELPARKTAVFRLATGADAAPAMLGSAGVREYRRESRGGVFDVEVRLSGEVKYQLHRTWCRLEATCPLKLQLAGADGGGSAVFQKTHCVAFSSSQRGC